MVPGPAPASASCDALEGVVDPAKEVLGPGQSSRYAVRVLGDALSRRGILERDILIAKADESPLSAARAWRSCTARRARLRRGCPTGSPSR
jgi:hypothetical protein